MVARYRKSQHLRIQNPGFWHLALILLLILMLLAPCLAQQRQIKFKRLILKDGSYELISQYQIHGDRVRYLSSERNAWEELPYSLVDWDATEKYASRAARQATEHRNEELEKVAAEREEEAAQTPLVAPGIRLPSQDGVYMLDVYQGQSVLSTLVQNGAELNRNTGKNILRGVVNPIASARQTFELKGLHAPICAHVLSPSFYFSTDPGDSSAEYNSITAKDHLRIVRCREKKGNRIVATIDIAVYGKTKEKAEDIKVNVEPVSDYWVKITPESPLTTGEYALVESDAKGSMNLFVWDFGVDPTAPPNPAAVQPSPDRSEPVLIQKNRKNRATE